MNEEYESYRWATIDLYINGIITEFIFKPIKMNGVNGDTPMEAMKRKREYFIDMMKVR